MNILYLGEKQNKKMFSFLSKYGETYFHNNELEYLNYQKFDWIVSYGYRHIISKNHIDNLKNPIINLHISYLPFNRGAHPNYWSFKEKTPKGVTIHFMDEGIDTGPILVQKNKYLRKQILYYRYMKLKQLRIYFTILLIKLLQIR